MDFTIGWFLDPVLNGHYPKSMQEYVDPKNLVPFTKEESQMLKKSIDFLGLNYYTAKYVSDDPNEEGEGYTYDKKARSDTSRDGIDIGPVSSGTSWLYMVPWGLYAMLKHIKEEYPNLNEVYITENGCSEKNDSSTIPARKTLGDSVRTKYYQDHLANLVKVMKDTGVNVKGFYAWSWCDNFEWSSGYSARFGLVYIDYLNNQTRYPKDSSAWFAQFLRSDIMPPFKLPWPTENGSDDEGDEPQRRPQVMEE